MLQGLVSVDRESQQATFRAGTTLKEVNTLLEDHGLAMSQLGSISDQTVAGAISTGASTIHLTSCSQGRVVYCAC